jgi:addiction module RelB/DinJ family antitoxin
MASSVRVNFVTDPSVKKKAEDVFEKLGLDLSTGLNLYLHQVGLRGGIPFPVELPSGSTRGGKKGSGTMIA